MELFIRGFYEKGEIDVLYLELIFLFRKYVFLLFREFFREDKLDLVYFFCCRRLYYLVIRRGGDLEF